MTHLHCYVFWHSSEWVPVLHKSVLERTIISDITSHVVHPHCVTIYNQWKHIQKVCSSVCHKSFYVSLLLLIPLLISYGKSHRYSTPRYCYPFSPIWRVEGLEIYVFSSSKLDNLIHSIFYTDTVQIILDQHFIIKYTFSPTKHLVYS